MIHAYHVILPCYGFWLPNDPRGSWSEFVYSWELVKFGEATKSVDQRKLAKLSDEELTQREAARRALRYPPVVLNGSQALSVANGFKSQAAKSGYSIWACAIMPEHTHLVIARHRYKVEQMAILLKGAATRQLMQDGNHPLAIFAKPGEAPPHLWAKKQWQVYLDGDEAIENAIAYVVDNPIREGKRRQVWRWVKPYHGLDTGWTTYH